MHFNVIQVAILALERKIINACRVIVHFICYKINAKMHAQMAFG
jgi:hypothetical protein